MTRRGIVLRIAIWAAATHSVLGATNARAADATADVEQTSPLRLEDVVASVSRSFPPLLAAEQERAIASADLLASEGGFDLSWKTRATIVPVGYYDQQRVESALEKPTSLWGVTPFVGYKLGRGHFAVYDGRLETLEYGEVRGGVNIPLWRNGSIDRRRANLAKAELGMEVANLTVAQQRLEVTRAATQRYWIWVAAGRRVAIANSLLTTALDRDVAIRERVSRGDLPEVELTDNQRAIVQRRSQLVLAERGLEQSTIELGLYLRTGSGAPRMPLASELPTSLPDPHPAVPGSSLPAEIAGATARRPEARRIALQHNQTAIELDYARNQLRPAIDVQLAGSQDIGPANPLRPDLSKPVFEASILLDVPLQTRAQQGRVDASAATLARLEQQRRFARERVEADVRDAMSAVDATRRRVEIAREELAISRKLEALERDKFALGDSTMLFVNLREQAAAEAALREVDALADFHRAEADLRAATARP